MPEPIAYLLTWTCHGSWLHGDERGSVDSDHNQYRAPVLKPDPRRLDRAATRMAHAAPLLGDTERLLVAASIQDHCTVRNWRLLAVNVRTTHVHCVVSAPRYRPEVVMGQLKAWATRRLCRHQLRATSSRLWTREGSTRYLFTPESVLHAVEYVRDRQ